ncbi:MAG: polyprenyl synthetase family protein [Spirochaetales bacterium]|jgi:geranylgeranyl diphosphate synthase type I|nr:polyprenyl synthetase family protein [Spirochaetales bacterium]
MFAYMQAVKTRLIHYLEEYFAALGPGFGAVNSWGPDALERLLDYTGGGKMIRGGLVSFTHDMYGGSFPEAAAAAGAAMELFQSAFLIHDDIMDRDETRRGKPALHAGYAALAREARLHDPAHTGEALGICAGDLALFIAFDILSGLRVDGGVKSRLLSRFCRELEYVGLAQMADVYQGASESGLAPENILALYRYKTGRYTFSLPFAAGLILAGRDEALVNQFVLLGEKMGVLFQIKDDELGLWADEKKLGKPVGSDIAENKKTLYREILFNRAGGDAKKKLETIFGKPLPAPGDIAFVLEQMQAHNVRAKAAETSAAFYREAQALIAGLPPGTSPVWMQRLRELLDYNMNRGN